jgi:TolB-like protein
MKLPAFVCLAIVSYASSVHAASPTIAVMPFHDLSGGKGSIGEAIRETVTSDLRDYGGVRVIERANLDKVLAEQSLQSKKDLLDPGSVVLVGKLVGATLIVAGAYQKSGSNVRLTARFVSVETTEIVGTAKVDGPQSDFLKLQDQVTAQLLQSAKMEPKKVQQFAARPRPKVKSIRAIELYGDAVVQTDDTKRLALLKEALSTDPGFVYASRDLDALEKRIRTYAQVAQGAQDAKLRDEMKQIDTELATEKDPLKIYTAYQVLFGRLMQAGRYRTLIAVARRVIANPPPVPEAYKNYESLEAQAQYWLVQSYSSLKESDHMLRECEVFLAKYPTSMYFSSVQMLSNVAIDQKRQGEAGEAEAADEISKMRPEQRSNPCYTGVVYNSKKQFLLAKRDLEQCVRDGNHHQLPWLPSFLLVIVNNDLGKFKDARKNLDFLRENFPDHYRDVRHFETVMPREE